MTDKEKKLIVDAIVEIADVSAIYDTEHRGKVDEGVAKQIAPITKKLSTDLGITKEVDEGLNRLIIKNTAEFLGSLLKNVFDSVNDDEEDDDDDEEGEE